MPAIQTFHDEFGGSDAAIVGVAFGASEAEVRALVDQQGLTFPNVYDSNGALPVAYAVSGVPNYIFLDKAGRIANEIRGAPHDVNYIRELLVELKHE